MRLKNYALAMAGAAVLAGCAEKVDNTFAIRGEIADETEGVIYLKRYEDKSFVVVDSAEIENGHFVFGGLYYEPLVYGLTTNRDTRRPVTFVLDRGETTVSMNESENTITVAGSPNSDIYFGNVKLVDNETFNIDSLIKAHPASPVPAYFLMRNIAWRLSLDEIKQLRAEFDSSLEGSEYINQIDTLTSRLERLQVGAVAPDFTMQDMVGNDVSLSDFRGQYVLVDFWASWCPDCRRENPNVVEAFNRYNERNFTVLGVSLDRERDPWIAAINNDGLTWTHVTDLKDWKSDVAVKYAVRWIPRSFLIDPEGRIVASGLEGEALLNKLDEVLPQKD